MPDPSALTRLGRAAGAQVLRRVSRPSPGRALFNSFNGKFSDSPRAIYEELARRHAPVQHTWMATPGAGEFPERAARVEPFSIGYLREAARAGYVVSNLQMPKNFVKRRGATYLQTWHGTPLKRIGFDNERWQQNPRGLDRMAREFAQWDFLVSQNRFSTEIFRRAFRFDGEILETGYPRNDLLRSPLAQSVRGRVRAELGIDEGARAILYAPTWRDNVVDDQGELRFSTQLDAGRLDEDSVLLVRLHYLLSAREPTPAGIDVSDYPDIRDLYLAADVLVTDYSSAMFDYAVTGKPIVFFVYDLDEYRDGVRGFYFDLEAEAPGPVCRSSTDLVDALGDLDAAHAAHAGRYARFRERFCPLDDGGAAARVVERVFTPPAARR